MDERSGSETTRTKNETTVERASERELVVRLTVNGPAAGGDSAPTTP